MIIILSKMSSMLTNMVKWLFRQQKGNSKMFMNILSNMLKKQLEKKQKTEQLIKPLRMFF
jgi:hypothetical protein